MKLRNLRSSYNLGYKPTRYFRPMLSYEEVQRRLNLHYGGELTIIEYNGTKRKGVLHCKKCGEFTTKSYIGYYINSQYHRKGCELCTYRERLSYYNSKIIGSGLVVTDYYSKGEVTFVEIYCKVCGKSRKTSLPSLHKDMSCVLCMYDLKTEEYSELLKNRGALYVGRETKDCGNLIIDYICLYCGKPGSINTGSFNSPSILCTQCNPNSHYNRKAMSKKETNIIHNNHGRVLLKFVNSRLTSGYHMFCGECYTTSTSGVKKSSTCSKCSPKIVRGKSKDHNKHLVEEYLIILYNVQKLKDFFVKHNQLQNIPEQPRTILEHIDGWIANYESIRTKYPNGDLGTVLENNPLYKQCEKVFYPIMDKYKIERIETLGGK